MLGQPDVPNRGIGKGDPKLICNLGRYPFDFGGSELRAGFHNDDSTQSAIVFLLLGPRRGPPGRLHGVLEIGPKKFWSLLGFRQKTTSGCKNPLIFIIIKVLGDKLKFGFGLWF